MYTPHLYVIGDSISIQYGPFLQQYVDSTFVYARKTQQEEAALTLARPQGDNGGDSSMVLEFLQAKQERGGIVTDLLLLNCGLHDIKTDPASGEKQVPIQVYEENLRIIVQLVEKMGPELLWVRTTPCDEQVHNRPGMAFHRFAADVRAYNEVADAVMQAAGVPSIDLYTFTCSLGSDLYCDHTHFYEHVRQKQAAYITGWLQAWRYRIAAGSPFVGPKSGDTEFTLH